jgi:hypothetical protein
VPAPGDYDDGEIGGFLLLLFIYENCKWVVNPVAVVLQ